MGTNAKRPHPKRPVDAPFLGVGLGLRPQHEAEVLTRAPRGALGVDWFEIESERFTVPGGRPLRILDEIAAQVPLVMRGVSLNIGSVDPLDVEYIDELALLAARVQPRWISDHLCWTGVDGHNLHALIPLPCTREAVEHVGARMAAVQERLGRRIALGNISTALQYANDEMREWRFLVEVAERADCGILLDVNSVYVNAHNHGFDAFEYIAAIPPERVFQLHLAGHREAGPLLLDTRDRPVSEEVWALYARTIEHLGPVSTLVAWDDEIPSYERLVQEAARAAEILERTRSSQNATPRSPDAPRRNAAPPVPPDHRA